MRRVRDIVLAIVIEVSYHKTVDGLIGGNERRILGNRLMEQNGSVIANIAGLFVDGKA